jgi:hypothetical protein
MIQLDDDGLSLLIGGFYFSLNFECVSIKFTGRIHRDNWKKNHHHHTPNNSIVGRPANKFFHSFIIISLNWRRKTKTKQLASNVFEYPGK